MKNFFVSYVVVTTFFLMAFKIKEVALEQQTVLVIEPRTIELDLPEIIISDFSLELKNHDAFLNKIGFVESTNDYSKVNRLGYLGRYQFGRSTLKSIGIDATRKQFLNSPELQETAMAILLKENHKSLKGYIDLYDGEWINGVRVTHSGILAAAHLGGVGNVINWFNTGEDFEDANGTSITKYMKLFSGYSLNIE